MLGYVCIKNVKNISKALDGAQGYNKQYYFCKNVTMKTSFETKAPATKNGDADAVTCQNSK